MVGTRCCYISASDDLVWPWSNQVLVTVLALKAHFSCPMFEKTPLLFIPSMGDIEILIRVAGSTTHEHIAIFVLKYAIINSKHGSVS